MHVLSTELTLRYAADRADQLRVLRRRHDSATRRPHTFRDARPPSR